MLLIIDKFTYVFHVLCHFGLRPLSFRCKTRIPTWELKNNQSTSIENAVPKLAMDVPYETKIESDYEKVGSIASQDR